MTYGIYCIRNTITGDCYVGASSTIELYWEQVKSDLALKSHLSKRLVNDWEIYGSDAFIWEILEETKPIRLVKFSRLQYWQRQLKATYNSGYTPFVGKSGIYQIRNTVTDECYVGASKDLQCQWNAHKRSLDMQKHHSRRLQASWNRYGADKFLFEVIEECKTDLRSRERDWYAKIKPSFNIKRH